MVWCNNMVSLTKCESDTSHRNTFDLCTCSSWKTEEANSWILIRQFFSFWTRQQKYSRKIDHYKILENYQLKYPGLPKPKDNCWGKVPGQALTACRVWELRSSLVFSLNNLSEKGGNFDNGFSFNPLLDLKKNLVSFACHSWLRGTLGATQYRNTARKIGKYRNTVSKIDEISIPHSCRSVTLT